MRETPALEIVDLGDATTQTRGLRGPAIEPNPVLMYSEV